MNKKQSQSGSAHLLVVILLVVALLGALGYAFYLNFIQSHSVEDTSTSVVVEPVATSEPNSLLITEWGIKGTYVGVSPIAYSISGNDLVFTSSDSPTNCVGDPVAGISRFTGDQPMSDVSVLAGGSGETVAEFYTSDAIGDYNGNKHIGDYYYIYNTSDNSGQGGGCYQKNSSKYDSAAYTNALNISNDVHEFFKTIQAI